MGFIQDVSESLPFQQRSGCAGAVLGLCWAAQPCRARG